MQLVGADGPDPEPRFDAVRTGVLSEFHAMAGWPVCSTKTPGSIDPLGTRRRGEGGGDGCGHGGVAGRGHGHFGEELGMAAVWLGDDVKKDGENIWISRMPIDLV